MKELPISSVAPSSSGLRYDGKIGNYTNFVNHYLDGVIARQGEFSIPKVNSEEKLDCVSIDSIPELTDEFCADLIPRPANGGYYLDLIVYTGGTGRDKFVSTMDGTGQARVRFDSNIKTAIRELLIEESGMQDLTLMPITPKDGTDAFLEHLSRVHKRLVENRNNLYLYYTSNIDGKSAFVVYIPQDPYQAASLVKKWFAAMKQLRNKQPNEKTD